MANYCAGNIARHSTVPKLEEGAATAIVLAGLKFISNLLNQDLMNKLRIKYEGASY